MQETFWALVPPIVAIALALITKEVYSSLFIGIVIGGLFYANFNVEGAFLHIVNDGFISVLSDGWNVGILIFLVILGTMVSLMNKTGGSAAFGEWAKRHIKGRVGAQLATILFGCLIFIDDYFNCLTVGSVMKPVTDKHKVSREKLAYLIDATAAPICIIAPISSWAAAVTGFVDGVNGLNLFVNAIWYNYYAILTIVFMLGLVLLRIDFGPMAKAEKMTMYAATMDETKKPSSAAKKDADKKNEADNTEKTTGKVIDLILPIVTLITACVIGMIYTGDFFQGESFIDAFANSNASVGLVLGSLSALLLTMIFYLVRRAISFKDCMDALPKGFNAMVPAILILTFAWTLKSMTDSLGAAEYVRDVVYESAAGFASFLPAIIFVIAALLAFATGTSWGTFGILIPIVVNLFQQTDYTMMVISISACMAGAVCGDHCSPISDTTIMASAGAQCNHVNHVSTQMPYVIAVACISIISYIVAGFVRNAAISMVVAFAFVLGLLVVLKLISGGKMEVLDEKQ